MSEKAGSVLLNDIEKQSKAPLVLLLLMAAAVAGSTWGVSEQIRVKPLQHTIETLERKLAETEKHPVNQESRECAEKSINCPPSYNVMVFGPSWINQGSAIETIDGHCLVSVGDSTLSVAIDQSKPELFVDVTAGSQKTIKGVLGSYVIDILEVRHHWFKPNQAYIEIRRMS